MTNTVRSFNMGLLVALTILVGALALALVLGLVTPETRSVKRQLTIRAPRPQVWRALTDPAQQSRWRPAADPARGAVELERVPPRHWAQALDPTCRWIYDLRAVPEGTRLTLTESRTIANPFYRFADRYWVGSATPAETTLRQLAAHFGHGARFEESEER